MEEQNVSLRRELKSIKKQLDEALERENKLEIALLKASEPQPEQIKSRNGMLGDSFMTVSLP